MRMNFKIYFYIVAFVSSTTYLIIYLQTLFFVYDKSAIRSSNDTDWIDFARFSTLQIGNLSRHDLTVVGIYFRLSKSKFSDNTYKQWFRNFFASCTEAPIMVFTDNQSIPFLVELAEKTPNPKRFFIAESVWSVLELRSAPFNASYKELYEQNQTHLDPERSRHSAELYAIWNVKPLLMSLASNNKYFNVFKSHYFLYTDMGAFRSHPYLAWPHYMFTLATLRRLHNRVLFGQVNFAASNVFSSLSDYLQGGFFAGRHDALSFFADRFYELHDKLLSAGNFVGKDQMLFNIFANINHPNRTFKLWVPHLTAGCIAGLNRWFFYQIFFASSNQIFNVTDATNSSHLNKICVSDANYEKFHSKASSILCDNGAVELSIERCFHCNVERKKPPPPVTTTTTKITHRSNIQNITEGA